MSIFLLTVHYQEVHTLNCLINQKIQRKVRSVFINKCFVWCHIRHLDPLKLNPEKKADRNMVNDLDFVDIKSLER